MKVSIFNVKRVYENMDASSKFADHTLYHIKETIITFEVVTDQKEVISGTYTVEGDEAHDILDISALIENLFNRK